MQEVFLLTKLDGADRWALVREDDVVSSLMITYSELDKTIERIGRDLYVVKYTREDVINTDVFTVQRVPFLEVAAHL